MPRQFTAPHRGKYRLGGHAQTLSPNAQPGLATAGVVAVPELLEHLHVTQAESYTSQLGTQTEATTDAGGGQDVGYIAVGDWLAYANVDFGSTGAASVTTRLASGGTNPGSVQYRLDSATGPTMHGILPDSHERPPHTLCEQFWHGTGELADRRFGRR